MKMDNNKNNRFLQIKQLFTTCINNITKVYGPSNYYLAHMHYRLGLLYIHDKVVDKKLTREVLHCLQKGIEIIKKGLIIEIDKLGRSHYKVLHHKALYLGEAYGLAIHIVLNEKDIKYYIKELKAIFETCILKTEPMFGPAHKVIKYCYMGLKKVYQFEGNEELVNVYANKLQLYRDIYEIKRNEERHISNWIIRYPDEWKYTNIINSQEYDKKLLKNIFLQYGTL